MITSPAPRHALPSEHDLSTLSQFESSIDRSSPTVQLLCEVPTWSSAFPDLAECSSLRQRALSALHCICADLKEQGLSPRYSLVPSTTSYSTIRISSPVSSTPPSPSLDTDDEAAAVVLSPKRRAGSIPTVEELAQLGPGAGGSSRKRSLLLPARAGEGATLVLV